MAESEYIVANINISRHPSLFISTTATAASAPSSFAIYLCGFGNIIEPETGLSSGIICKGYLTGGKTKYPGGHLLLKSPIPHAAAIINIGNIKWVDGIISQDAVIKMDIDRSADIGLEQWRFGIAEIISEKSSCNKKR